MKVIVYSSKAFETDLIEKENSRKFEIRYVNAALCIGTASYAKDCSVAVVFVTDEVSAEVISILAESGVKLIITRSVGTDHIDLRAAELHGIEIQNVPSYSPEAIAEHSVALALSLSRKLTATFDACRKFDFRIDNHMGFNFYGKTVGIIGLGKIGGAVARIYKGLGCNVLSYDLEKKDLPDVEQVDLKTLLNQSDVVTLHLPYSVETHHLIDKDTIAEMKDGVMLINTSRGKVIDTASVADALQSRKIGYLGLDVYEFEKGLFFEDHQFCLHLDPLIARLMSNENVLITPHQAFLTIEAVSQIARSVISSINNFAAKNALLLLT